VSDQPLINLSPQKEIGDDDVLFDLPEGLLEVDCSGMVQEDEEVVDKCADVPPEEHEKLPFAQQAKDTVLVRCTADVNETNDPFLYLLEKISSPDFQDAMKAEFEEDKIEHNAQHVQDVLVKMQESDDDILDAAAPPAPDLVQATERTKAVARAFKIAQTGATSGGDKGGHAVVQAATHLLDIAREIAGEGGSKMPAATDIECSQKGKADSSESVATADTKRSKFTSKSFTEVFTHRHAWE